MFAKPFHGKKLKDYPNREREECLSNVSQWTTRPQSLSAYACELPMTEMILGASKNPHNAGEMVQSFRGTWTWRRAYS
ncbi:MAG: hypothetical protein OJF51_000558 [Nitrospira sp.]|nr:MAG: hypothetical protein OJF51_000558 [Nitrospira sp.]